MQFKRVQILIFCIFLGVISQAATKIAPDLSKNVSKDMCAVNSKCVMKCCGIGKYIIGDYVERKLSCAYYKNAMDIKPLDEDFKDVFVHKPNLSSFDIKPEIFRVNKTFSTSSIDVTDKDLGLDLNVYLNEDAEVMLETPNAYDRWTRIPNDMYCLDKILIKEENRTDILKPGVWIIYQDAEEKASRPTTLLMNAGMLVSCFFLLLVLVVYSVLPELRNLCGMILMAYVASLLGAFLLLSTMRLGNNDTQACEGLTYLIYFFFMASFCWMNVMSYDIWWTFRGYAKARPIHRRGEKFKFLMYCLYAFGLPLAMTIMLAVLNNVDMRHEPGFVTPKIPSTDCFIEGGEQLLYMYVPMLILILCNWMFFLMTAFNIWRLSRGTAVLDSAAAGTPHAHRTNRRRFIIYLKLSVVMGLNWLLEVMSYSYTDSVIWVISDCYNILIGVAIFLIFVCKRKILKKIKLRFSRGKKSKWYPNQEESSKVATSTCDSTATASQETQSVPLVCYNNTETPEIVFNKS